MISIEYTFFVGPSSSGNQTKKKNVANNIQQHCSYVLRKFKIFICLCSQYQSKGVSRPTHYTKWKNLCENIMFLLLFFGGFVAYYFMYLQMALLV